LTSFCVTIIFVGDAKHFDNLKMAAAQPSERAMLTDDLACAISKNNDTVLLSGKDCCHF
jgi:hypothetical protein